MSTLSIREISEMTNRCPKAIHKQVRRGKLKARKEFSYVTSPYYVRAYIKKNRCLDDRIKSITDYMHFNKNWFVYSASGLAKLLDVTPQSIHNWVKKGYLEEDFGPGLYSRKSVLRLAKKHPRFDKFMPKGGESA